MSDLTYFVPTADGRGVLFYVEPDGTVFFPTDATRSDVARETAALLVAGARREAAAERAYLQHEAVGWLFLAAVLAVSLTSLLSLLGKLRETHAKGVELSQRGLDLARRGLELADPAPAKKAGAGRFEEDGGGGEGS